MKPALLWLFPLALAACSPAPQQASTPPPASGTTAPAPAGSSSMADTSTLVQYHWRLAEATDKSGKHIDALFVRSDKPLELNFNGERVNVVNSCNSMLGGYHVDGTQLQVGPLAHTLMACPDPALAALDEAISQRLQGSLQWSIKTQDAAPQLQLVTAGGDTLRFAGEATAETRYGGPGDIVFLEVAAQAVPCHHPLIPNKMCLQVRERHYDAQGLQTGTPGDWQPLNQDIEGYTHEPGIRNVLRVKRYAIKNPPADAPDTAYVLDMVVESEKVAQ